MQPRERLEAMLARSEKATKAPWYARYTDRVTLSPQSDGADSVCHVYESGGQQQSNRDFIAAARTDLPATVKCLLAVMDKLGETKHEFSIRSIFADEILDIINRELGE